MDTITITTTIIITNSSSRAAAAAASSSSSSSSKSGSGLSKAQGVQPLLAEGAQEHPQNGATTFFGCQTHLPSILRTHKNSAINGPSQASLQCGPLSYAVTAKADFDGVVSAAAERARRQPPMPAKSSRTFLGKSWISWGKRVGDIWGNNGEY